MGREQGYLYSVTAANNNSNIGGQGAAGLKITDMNIANFVASGAPIGTIQGGAADFVITVRKQGFAKTGVAGNKLDKGSYGANERTLTFPLSVYVDTGTNLMTSCFSSVDAISATVCGTLGGTFEFGECRGLDLKDLDAPNSKGYGLNSQNGLSSNSLYVGSDAVPPASPPAPSGGLGVNVDPPGDGQIATSGDVAVGADLTATNVTGSGVVTGNSVLSTTTMGVGTTLTVTGTSNLTVTNVTNFTATGTSNLAVTNITDLTVTGTSTLNGNVTVGTATAQRELTVSGNVTINGAIGDDVTNMNRAVTKQWVVDHTVKVLADALTASLNSAQKQAIIDAIQNQISSSPLDTLVDSMAARPTFQEHTRNNTCTAVGGVYNAGSQRCNRVQVDTVRALVGLVSEGSAHVTGLVTTSTDVLVGGQLSATGGLRSLDLLYSEGGVYVNGGLKVRGEVEALMVHVGHNWSGTGLADTASEIEHRAVSIWQDWSPGNSEKGRISMGIDGEVGQKNPGLGFKTNCSVNTNPTGPYMSCP